MVSKYSVVIQAYSWRTYIPSWSRDMLPSRSLPSEWEEGPALDMQASCKLTAGTEIGAGRSLSQVRPGTGSATRWREYVFREGPI